MLTEFGSTYEYWHICEKKSFRWRIWRSEFWFLLTDEHFLLIYAFLFTILKQIFTSQSEKNNLINPTQNYEGKQWLLKTTLFTQLTRTFPHDIMFEINNWITFCIYEINIRVRCYLTIYHFVFEECYVSSHHCILHKWSLLCKWKSNLALGEYEILPTPEGKNKTEKSIYVHTTKCP
jgi:hypothetical protein